MKLSVDAILTELAYYSEQNMDIVDFLDEADDLLDSIDQLDKKDYNKITKRLKLDILDVNRYVEVNNCKQVSNPRAFSSNNIPDKNGLLSNEIFGYTMMERSGTYGYISLNGYFLDPSCYKTWIRLDTRIKNIVHGIKYYKITPEGDFIEDENGQTGLEFLRKNIKRIKFKNTGSKSKQLSIKYLDQNRDRMFIDKYIVIPPFYRDKNTASSSRRTVGLGGINKIYNNLIVAANSLTATQDFGFDASYSMQAQVQEIMLRIYDWFCGNNNEAIKADAGQGLSGKLGIVKRAAMSKTSNFSTRLVISCAELKVDRPENLMVTFDKSAIPLYAVITQFRDFVMYYTRLFFQNEFRGAQTYPVMTKNGQFKSIVPEDPEITFSDERIKMEMDRFVHGYNNRLVPIEIPVEGTNEVYYMKMKEQDRRLTWCDVFYMASVEATKDKHVLITRFPIDFFSNQITTKIEVASTKETEPLEVNGVMYRFYPKIREKDIGSDTSNTFSDTLVFNNTYLKGMGGDFDGDQCTCKGVYTREANDELERLMNSKQNFINFGASPLREFGDDTYQSIFALTRVISSAKITSNSSIEYK